MEQLTQLQELDLPGNQLAEIKGLEKLTQLRTLWLDNNQLTEIKGLEQLTQLKYLDLRYNQLTEIEGLEQLTQLQYLYLSSNQITEIEPLENIIASINKLKIYRNRFSNPKLEENENNLDAVRKYFSDKKLTQKEFKLPAKVMFLGNHAAGKSTFLYYLKNNKLPEEGEIPSTHILEIEPYNLSVEYKQQEETVILPDAMIYDFGGHDYYHGIYRAFFSHKSITLLVWCIKSDKNDVTEDKSGQTRDFTRNYWLHQLKNFSKQKQESIEKRKEVVFMVQTHADEDVSEVNEKNIGNRKDFNIHNEYYVSLKKGFVAENKKFEWKLNTLKEELFQEISTKRDETIEKRPEYYETFLNFVIHYKNPECIEVDEILKNHYKRPANKGETKEDLLLFLKMDLQDLNDTGLSIYYKEDKDLNDIVWLNPKKTIKHIHDNVLSQKIIENNEGKVSELNFNEIFDTENKKKIKKLLLNQKVVFYDKYKGQYIIPGYLPLVDTKYDELCQFIGFNEEKPNYTLRFKNFLPFGLINQLICLYGGKPDIKDFWRDRLIFTFDKTYKVLIILDFSNLEIKIYIKEDNEKLSSVSLHDIERLIFLNIIDLYNNDEIKPDMIPEDLYISVKGEEYYAQFRNIKEQVNKNDKNITVYPINKETNEINFDKEKQTTRKISNYIQFTNNKNIKKMKKIFISYSKKDIAEMHEFLDHTVTLQEEGLISKPWTDEWIAFGKEWDNEIKHHIEECDILICLVSVHFLNTNYIRKTEITEAMKQNKILVPIIIKPCDWEHCDFAKYQVALKGKCITLNENQEYAIKENSEIERAKFWVEIIKEMRAKIFNNE